MSELSAWGAKNAGSISAAGNMFGGAMKAYGAYTAGGQAENYYETQSALTQRSKAEAKQVISLQIREAGLLKDQADDLLEQAEVLRQSGKITERKFQKETDKGISSSFAQMAKSGVKMTYGSPMDVIDEIATERAKDFDILKWSNNFEYTQRVNEGRRAKEKATIMLDRAALETAGLASFDIQSGLYRQAGETARISAITNIGTALMGASEDVFGSLKRYEILNKLVG